jgi:uncharacterized protein (TIGR02270 family)
LDNRIEAHLDGLRIAGGAGWDVARKELEKGEPGEVFAAAVLAFESGDPAHVQDVLQVASAEAASARGLTSALGWLPYAQAERPIRQLLDNELPLLRRAGIAAAAAHRRHPGRPLTDALRADHVPLQARALRAFGELGDAAGKTVLRPYLTATDPLLQFSAAWSVALLGDDRDAVAALLSLAGSPTPFWEKALQLAVRRLDPPAGSSWLRQLTEQPHQRRRAAVAIGAGGYPEFVPWLLEQMKSPELARVGGEAFSLITGVDLAYQDLDQKKPEGFEAGPTENPADDDVAMDQDENLPWPNSEAIRKWWAGRQQDFANGTRYCLGQPMSVDWLQQVLRIGLQRQRAAAALELAVRQPGQPLFEVRAPGFRQAPLVSPPAQGS